MNVAKVLQGGSDRAIRLPDEFRGDADEVYLRRTPERFLVIPRDPC
jgi:virulence-associated protein VagC